MTKAEAKLFYRTQTALAAALGLSKSTVCEWVAIPHLHQLRLQKLTRGKLKADEDALKPKRGQA